MDSIIRQANELGCFFFLFSGGEPLVRKDDIIRLCEAHPDCQFTAFTNATLIDDAFAREMLRVKNFIPAISVEGFEEATDFRRGEGTFRKVEKAMELLKSMRLPFGVSCCYTSRNAEVIGSEEYFDQMVRWGARFCWLFTAYRSNQPWNENHLRPCPLLDNPEKLKEAVLRSGAHSTDMENPEDVRDLTAKCEAVAEKWAPVADEIWECSGH
ncbi:MAG: radical SAM protein [Emergencia sp.]